MKTVKVSKKDLLAKLNENREIHKKELVEFKKKYNEEVISKLEEILKFAKTNPENPHTSIHAVKPESYLSEYDEVIGMLEMSIENKFEITQEEYRQYVMNKWRWSNSFEMMKSSYVN